MGYTRKLARIYSLVSDEKKTQIIKDHFMSVDCRSRDIFFKVRHLRKTC